MPYPINRTDGTLLLNVQDFTRDSESTSLTLLGRGSVDYGESVAENLVHLLENFSSPTPPANPLQGQVWYHTFNPGPPIQLVNKLKVFDGTAWTNIGGATTSVDPPESPEPGDLWYNLETEIIMYWDGDEWKPVGGPYVGEPTDPEDPESPNEPPADPSEGQLWWMLPDRKLWGFDSSLEGIASFPPNAKRQNGDPVPNGWVLIGPDGIQDPEDPTGGTYNYITNVTVINPDTGEEEEVPMNMIIVDGQIITVWVAKTVELTEDAILGMPFGAWTDPYDPASSPRILRQGQNMNHNAGMTLYGQISDAERLNGLNGSQFLRSDITTFPLVADSSIDLGKETNRWGKFYAKKIFAGTSTEASPDVSAVNIFGKVTRAEICDAAETAKAFLDPKTLSTANASNDVATDNEVAVVYSGVLADPAKHTYYGSAKFTELGEARITEIATVVVENVVGNSAGNFVPLDKSSAPTGQHNLGNAGAKWGSIFAERFEGVAASAEFADLAERYETDYKYPKGTLISIGGEKEITQTSGAYDYDFFGVISDKPAYLMNAAAGNDDSHPPVALSGRVEVRVIGPVRKGQRLVLSQLQGVAEAFEGSLETINPYFVVGRALADKTTDEEGLVLCVVGNK